MGKDESLKEKFKKVGERRTRQVLRELGKLANCSEKRFYWYSGEDVEKIFGAIDKQLEFVKSKFYLSSVEDFNL